MSAESRADWRPALDPDRRAFRARALAEIRSFFAERGVLEVMTPVLSRGANPDPRIDSFFTGSGEFARTSPEFFHKRLLAADSGSIFEIGPVFRRGEVGRWHNPEFIMVEWYRTDTPWRVLAEETAELSQRILALGGVHLQSRRLPFAELLEQARAQCGLDDAASLEDQARILSGVMPRDRIEALELLFAFATPRVLSEGELTLISDFPSELASLAEIDGAVASRFELFCGQLELANGYQELLDVDELVARLEKQNSERSEPVPLDMHLIAAQRSGLPACSGVALGFDRLVAAALQASSLASVQEFGWAQA